MTHHRRIRRMVAGHAALGDSDGVVQRAATTAEQSALRAEGEALERYVMGTMAPTVGGALALWNGLGTYLQASVSEDTRKRNAALQASADKWRALVAGLRSGELELAAWVPEGKAASPQLGIRLASGLGIWPIVIAVIAIGAVLAAWKVTDVWGEAERLKAEAEAVRAQTARDVQATVARVAQTDPAAAAKLATTLTTAQQAANAAGSSWLGGAAGAALKSTGAALLAAAGIWLALQLYGRRRT
jgi:hypothetical protein